ncbi:hypothetical protein OEG84_08540 [Hoeflea sp. G2-23]|uniref:DUF1127 domain-containing protein n=1 Tax=Hoeflea algicola TaxID=2983763 RepID=A0ABT3Z7K7_9HYPH|nr:hypothetical protein [Hoeflea algicola]MCY0147761.1 hypothetical protein [Hoeflea algicola]
MFELSSIARLARQWRAERNRRAMERQLYALPLELQKDIGWRASARQYAPDSRISKIPGCPLV